MTTKFLFTALILTILLSSVGGYYFGILKSDIQWTERIYRAEQEQRQQEAAFSARIEQYHNEALKMQQLLSELKTEQNQTIREYEKTIGTIDTLTVSQLQRYFAERYGDSTVAEPGTPGNKRPYQAGLSGQDGEVIPEGN